MPLERFLEHSLAKLANLNKAEVIHLCDELIKICIPKFHCHHLLIDHAGFIITKAVM